MTHMPQQVLEGGKAALEAEVRKHWTEAEFQGAVVALAHEHGGLVHAERPASSRRGKWSTPIQGDAGWPDLVLARRKPDGTRQLCFLELKSQRGRGASIEQEAWLDTLGAHMGAVLRPSDWPAIAMILA